MIKTAMDGNFYYALVKGLGTLLKCGGPSQRSDDFIQVSRKDEFLLVEA